MTLEEYLTKNAEIFQYLETIEFADDWIVLVFEGGRRMALETTGHYVIVDEPSAQLQSDHDLN